MLPTVQMACSRVGREMPQIVPLLALRCPRFLSRPQRQRPSQGAALSVLGTREPWGTMSHHCLHCEHTGSTSTGLQPTRVGSTGTDLQPTRVGSTSPGLQPTCAGCILPQRDVPAVHSGLWVALATQSHPITLSPLCRPASSPRGALSQDQRSPALPCL